MAIKTMSKSEVLRASQAEHVLAEHAVLETVCGDARNASLAGDGDATRAGGTFEDSPDASGDFLSEAARAFLVSAQDARAGPRGTCVSCWSTSPAASCSRPAAPWRFARASRFYAAEVVLALEYRHDRQIAANDETGKRAPGRAART